MTFVVDDNRAAELRRINKLLRRSRYKSGALLIWPLRKQIGHSLDPLSRAFSFYTLPQQLPFISRFMFTSALSLVCLDRGE